MKNEYDYLNDVKMDFSLYTEETESCKEDIFMKYDRNKRRKVLLIAACVTIFTITSAFATGIVGNIIKSVSTGHNEFHQIDPNAQQEIPEYLKGKLFDENGVELESIAMSDYGNFYDKDGNKITDEAFAKMIEEATDGLVAYSDGSSAPSYRYFANLEQAQMSVVFDIKAPTYIPNGYELSDIYNYMGTDGTSSGEYLNLVYKNTRGDKIKVFERLLNEDTAFEAGTTGTLEEVNINGNIGVIMNDASLNFETDDCVSVGIYVNEGVSKAELIMIAESIG